MLADISPDSMIRVVKKETIVANTDFRCIGVDDWAVRKGNKYRTLVCDLKTRKPIDLLPDRSYERFAEWLKKHPHIEFISMDRAVSYCAVAKDEQPGAKQVADRFHLVHNLGQTLMKYLQRKFTNGVMINVQVNQGKKSIEAKMILSKKEQEQINRANSKWALIQSVQKLYEENNSQRHISSVPPPTIQGYMRCKSNANKKRLIPLNQSFL